MQTGNPDVLKILHITFGGKIFEDELEEKFKKYNYRGEWYHPSEEILYFIDYLKERDGETRFLSIVELALALGETLSLEDKKLLQELVNGEKLAPGVKLPKIESILEYYKKYLKDPKYFDEFIS